MLWSLESISYPVSFIILFVFTLSFSNITLGQGPGGPTAADIDCTGCVDTVDIADNAVTNAKIANDAVTGGNVVDNTLTSADIQDNSLTTVFP